MSSDISDIAQTIKMLVARTLEALNGRHLRGGCTVTRDLKRRIWERFRINAARTENALLPIHRLPAEVFLLCVDHYLSSSHIDSICDMESYRRLQTLSSVCWSWKFTIDNTPALWSCLPRWSQSDQHAELCLSRSAHHSLAIDFYLYRYSLGEFDERILPNLGRCSNLSLQVDRYFEVLGSGLSDRKCVSAFGRFKRAQMPLLECLSLCGPHADISDLDIFAVHPESPLKRIDLDCWHCLSLETPPTPTLKHLSMVCGQHHSLAGDVLDVSRFFGVLHLSALEHLDVCHIDFEPVTDATPIAISLRQLRHLRLEQRCSFTLDFLKRAEMPSLQTFHVGEPQYGLHELNCHHVDQLEMFTTPLIHNALQRLPHSSLRLEVTSAPVLIVKVCDDVQDYIKIFFLVEAQTTPTQSFHWLKRVLQDAPRPIPLHVTFEKFPKSLSDESLLDALANLPHVKTITVKGCSDVIPVVRSLGSRSAEGCPLPELTNLVFDSIHERVWPRLVQWVQDRRPPTLPPINISFRDATSPLLESGHLWVTI